MLKRFLRDVRQKPKGVRDNIALVLAATFTAMVSSVWLYHVPSKVETLVAREEATKEDPAFTSFFSGMKEQLANLQGTTEETEVVTNEKEFAPMSDQDPSASTVSATSSLDSFLFATSTPTSSSTAAVATTSQEAAPVLINAPREIRIITVPASTTATTSPERQ